MPDAAARDEALIRRVVDSISSMLAYWDTDLRCRFANRAYERWFGVSPESLIGKQISELLGPIYPLNLPYIQGALRGEAQQFEREIPDPRGGPARHSLAHYVPDVVAGVVRGFFVLVTDISERKRFELALQESEAKFSGIISISADAIISVDEDQRITIFNEGAERIFGYTTAEIVGTSLDRLLPERLLTAHRRHVEVFAAGQTTARQMGDRNAMLVGVRKNGQEFPAEAAISKLEVGGKRLFTVALRDITERKRVELEQEILAEAGAVLASSLDYKKTLQTISRLIVPRVTDLCAVDVIEEGEEPVRLTMTSADPTKVSVCEKLTALPLRWRRLLSWSAVDTKQTVVLAEIGPEQWKEMAQSQEHLELFRELAPRSAVIAPMFSTAGVFGALILASSSAGRFAARDAPFATELARRAALAIENSRLYEAEKRATRARDDVMGIVAHDVRTPLTAIRLAATTLDRLVAEAGSAKGSKSVGLIFRAVDRADRLIQDLLDTTRIEGGVLFVEREAVSPRQIVVDVVEAQRSLASAASLELRLDAGEELPSVWADRARVMQVFENLVANALKFTPKGGSITVGAATREADVLFWVADSGGGIPAENLPRIFDRFWQARRTDRQGAGLGLPICKGLVEAHGGRIWVESTVGGGTTFCLTLPTSAANSAPKPLAFKKP